MRHYGSSNQDSFNTYRSGHERSRMPQYSDDRNASSGYGWDTREYGSQQNRRRDQDYDSRGTTNWSSQGSSMHGSGSGYGGSSRGSSYGSQHSSGSPYGSGRNYGSSTSYGSGSYGTSGMGSSYGNRYEREHDRDIFDRAGDSIERTGQRVRNAWNRWTDEDENRRNERGWTGSGTSGWSGSNANRYSTEYDNRNRTYNDFDNDRYMRHHERNMRNDRYDRNQEDRGFFERAADEVRSWFTDDDNDRNRRDERYNRDNDNRWRTEGGYPRNRSYSGPPYSYGSSSARDYEW